MDDWQPRAKLLAAELDASPEWKSVFAATPRHKFVPRLFTNDPQRGWLAVDQSDDDYPDLVYRNEALIIQLDGDPQSWEKARRDGFYLGGHATSSSSAPQLMASMLDELQVEPGMNVLEVGTGTGYNAAILCRRLGDVRVTTVDVDPDLVALAETRLADLDYYPSVATVDAAVEVPGGPYDRVMATVGVRRVPYGWVRAVKPGGRILVNVYSDLGADAIFALTVHRDGTASGPAAIGGTFMPTRDNIMPFNFELHDGAEGASRPTELGGDVVGDVGPFHVFASLIMRDVQIHQLSTIHGYRPGLLGRDRSWAYEMDGVVHHGGPQDLWRELEKLHTEWEAHGRPGREQLGLTVGPSQQTLWVNAPDQPVHAELDSVSFDRE